MSARTAIRDLLATENFTAVRLVSNRLEARWSPRASKIDEDVDVLRRRLETTANLAAACGYPPRLGP